MEAFQGIGAVVSTQLLSRAVTFLMNAAIARVASPAAYGIGFISLQLFSNLSLFVTKEGFRKVALRQVEEQSAESLNSSVNLAWCGTAVAAIASLPLAWFWLPAAGESVSATYTLAVALMAVASVVEAVGEPYVVVALLNQDFKGRAMGEGAAMMVRTVCMLGIVLAFDDLPLAFALSQLLYSAVWLAWFMRLAHASAVTRPARLRTGTVMLPLHWSLLVEFSGTVFVKLALTEGEKFLLLRLFTGDDLGVYGLVSNLGSIVLRLLFAPIEEIAYSAFAKGGADGQGVLLRSLLLLQGGVGWLGLCFGPGFAALAIRIMYGAKWASSSAPTVLAAYVMQLFFMALNGILEAYMYSKAKPDWLRTCNKCQVGIWVVMVAVAYFCRGLGPVALVLANVSAMFLRVLLCLTFVRQLGAFASLKDLRLVPVAQMFGLFLVGGLLCSTLVPQVGERIPWLRVLMAVAAAGVCILASVFLCRGELRQVWGEVRTRKAH